MRKYDWKIEGTNGYTKSGTTEANSVYELLEKVAISPNTGGIKGFEAHEVMVNE